MEDQIPPSQVPSQPAVEGQITAGMIAEMKARARELAVQQTIAQRAAMQDQQQLPQIVYVKRNLTVAEILLTLLLACGIVTGVQWSWNIASNVLPRVEIKVR
jgi:hypothetical protein